MSAKFKLRPGARVHVYWGLSATREGTLLEVWGDPANPSHVRVRLDSLDDEIGPSVLLLDPSTLVEAA